MVTDRVYKVQCMNIKLESLTPFHYLVIILECCKLLVTKLANVSHTLI